MSAVRRTALVLVGLILLSLNLRPAAVSVGPVLEEVRHGLGLNGAEAGSAHLAAGAGVRGLRRAGAVHRARRRPAPCPGALARRGGDRARRAGRGPRPGCLPGALGDRARRHGDRQRADPVPGQAALPRPDRARHRDLHHRPRDRADLCLSADRADLRLVRRLATRPRRVVAPRPGRPRAVAGHARARQAPRDRGAEHLVRRRGAHPHRLGDGALLRPAVAPGLLDLRLVRPAVARLRLLRGASRAARRDRGRRQHPVVVVAAVCCSPAHRPARSDPRGAELLSRRLCAAPPRRAPDGPSRPPCSWVSAAASSPSC